MEDARRFFSREQDVDKHGNFLPHWQQGSVWCLVTWRLADSVPAALFDEWEKEREIWLSHYPKPWDAAIETAYHIKFSRKMDEWLDQGFGDCMLRDSRLAATVGNALKHFHGERYELRNFVVMPNHVHVLFHPLGAHLLADILKSWKGFTAREINRLRSEEGAVWQPSYWDRLIRNPRHLEKAAIYIRENPVKQAFGRADICWASGLEPDGGGAFQRSP